MPVPSSTQSAPPVPPPPFFAAQSVREQLQKHKQYLLTGVSHVIPLIACGGILIAVALTCALQFGYVDAEGAADMTEAPALLRGIFEIGRAAFQLFPAVLAAFIAHAIAGKPGLVPGFIGGYMAGTLYMIDGKATNAGFLGAIIIGLVAGHLVNALKKLRVPAAIRPLMPILVIPIVAGLAAGLLMMAINVPLATVMAKLAQWLDGMQGGSQALLAMILGAMIAFDLGGPVNKTAFFFGAAMMQSDNYAVMGACAAAICTPPLGMGLATLLNRKAWTQEQRQSGVTALGMGLIGITEGAIPFVVAEPLRVMPGIMAGSMAASTIAMLGGVGNHAPHGGLVVLPVVDNKLVFIGAILAGALVTAITVNLTRKFSNKPNNPDNPELQKS